LLEFEYVLAQVKEYEMSKRILFTATVLLVVALMTSETAFTALAATTTHEVNRVGIVTAIGRNKLTILSNGNNPITVKVGDNTRYQRVNGGTTSFSKIGLGQRITAIGTFDRQHVLNATTIVVMPARLNKGKWIGSRAYGTILWVIPSTQTFMLITNNGSMKFTVDDSTRFAGKSVRNFDALKAGMNAVVSYRIDREGNLYARAVSAY